MERKCLNISLARIAQISILVFASTSIRADPLPPDTRAVAMTFESGSLRTRVQMVFDPKTRTLVRKTYSVWDPMPSKDLTFTWEPDAGPDADRRVASGNGRLTWRLKAKPSYDPSGTYAEYIGRIHEGRPDGFGTFALRDGSFYEGSWKDGRIEGKGLLRFEDGAEYAGMFHDGEANGQGTFIDIDGEVYEGPFKNGLRDGTAETTLPNKFKYRSRWTAGREVDSSRTIRIAQNGGTARMPAEDVRIGIVVDRPHGDDNRLKYFASSSAPGLGIKPDNKRLMDVWKGDASIHLTENEEMAWTDGTFGIFAYTPEAIAPLNLTLQFQNRSDRNIQVTGVFLDMASSVTDRQPAVQLSVGTDDKCDSRHRPNFSPSMELQNFGWGAAENPEISYRIGKTDSVVRKHLSTLSSSEKIDLETRTAEVGADVRTLSEHKKKEFPCENQAYETCFASLKTKGIFGELTQSLVLKENNIIVPIEGNLKYDWHDDAGGLNHRSSKFKTNIVLARLQFAAECGEGGEPQMVSHKRFELKLDQSNYRIPLAFEAQVPAGQQARYLLALHATKSSHHQFKIVVQLADGREIRSRPIDLIYFVPNWKPPA
jgi:hypothetical protein